MEKLNNDNPKTISTNSARLCNNQSCENNNPSTISTNSTCLCNNQSYENDDYTRKEDELTRFRRSLMKQTRKQQQRRNKRSKTI